MIPDHVFAKLVLRVAQEEITWNDVVVARTYIANKGWVAALANCTPIAFSPEFIRETKQDIRNLLVKEYGL